MSHGADAQTFRVAHLTTVDLSLRFLVMPQLRSVVELGGESIGISAPGPWVTDLTEAGVRHIPLTASTRGVSPLGDLRTMVQLWRVLRRERLTVLHTHNPKPGIYGRVLGRLAGVPLVVNTLHGLYATEDDPRAKRALVYLLEAVAARFSHVELHQNPEDLDFCTKKRIVPPGKGRLLGNGVDLERFDPTRFDHSTREKVRKELGADDDTVVVGIVGRLVAEKGYPELFQAAERLGQGYLVVVVGPDDPEKADALPRDMIDAAQAHGVRFLGMRSDVDDLYTAMDLFVLPSHREGFPRAAMEAAAMGLPVVATDIRGCRQVVEDGVNGVLFEVGDVTALTEAIRRIGSDRELRNEMGEASRHIARARFDETKVVEIVLDAYRQGLSARGLGHVLPTGMLPPGEPSVRRARGGDAPALAALHSSEISSGFLSRLGRPFLATLYRAMIDWEDAVVLVAEDGAGPLAFVAGVSDVGSFYRHFLRRHGLRAALQAAPRLLTPANLRRAWETLRYGGEESDVSAELLSMVVAPKARGRGMSTVLGERFLSEMSNRGVPAIRVVVGSGNQAALAAYRRMSFREAGSVEVHEGERSEVLVWRP